MITGVTTRMLLQFIIKIHACKEKGVYVLSEQWDIKKLKLFHVEWLCNVEYQGVY
jgi:hypothetical protein